ncbi:MAG: alpha/beta hydrolase [Oligoflexia bacterium]|nr:alpha/beta hydrolase [Oligoflexia bacterium]
MSSSKGESTDKAFDEVRRTADRVGSDPLWLKGSQSPSFQTVEPAQDSAGKSGPEVLLLHGLLGALSNWESVFPLLSQTCRPIALHLPILSGHRSEVKIKALASYTELFVRNRKLDPVAICGNSLGGHVAMRLCLACPELVDCLILSGSSGLYEHSVDALPVRPDRNYIRDHMGRVFCNTNFITDDRIEEIYSLLADRKNVLNLIHAARSAKRDNMLDVLKEIKVPVLLLWGEDDEVTTIKVAETFHKNLPNSKLVTIKKCGHAPMIEHPEWFAEQVNLFLKQHSKYYRKAKGS